MSPELLHVGAEVAPEVHRIVGGGGLFKKEHRDPTWGESPGVLLTCCK